MAMLIIFTIFGLFWLGTTLASVTYMVFKNSKSLTQKLKNHSPFWLQDYYAFLNRYHTPLLVASISMGIGLTVWGITSPKQTDTQQINCWKITEQRENRETRIIIKKRGCDNTRKQITYIQRSAIPYGGTENLYNYFEKNKQNTTGKTGTIYLQFFVQEDGSLADISILSGINPELDNEAIRLIKEYPEDWKPALYNGRAVEQRVVIPVQF